MSNGKTSYEYILIEDIFVNLNQNIITLYYNIYIRAKSFGKFDRLAKKRLPKFILRAVRVLQFTYEFYHAKKDTYAIESKSIITSEHNGNCLIRLRQGECKVFNLKNGTVITAFPKHVPLSVIGNTINKIKESERCILAPKLLNWDVKERYLVEEYKNNRICSYDLNDLKRYIIIISPILSEIISVSKPKLVNLLEYSQKNIKYLDFIINANGQYNRHDEVNLDFIRQFLDYSMDMIIKKQEGQSNVTLVFSHGDLWEGNILIKGKDANVIDWGTHGCRSFYHDFYFSIFMLASQGKNFDMVDYGGINFLHDEMDTSCNLLYDHFLEIFKDSDHIIPKQFDVYRYIFYIELIVLKLNVPRNVQQENFNEINTWIKRFSYFEGLRN